MNAPQQMIGEFKTTPDLVNRFTYHKPLASQPAQYERIRDEAHRWAALVSFEAPDCRERSLAITKIEEAVFWANAAIARHAAPEGV